MRRPWILLAAATLVLGLPNPASGDRSDVGPEENSYQVTIVESQQTQSDFDTYVQVAAAITYSYAPACIRGEGIRGPDYYGCGSQMECGQNGHVFTVYAHLPDGTTNPLGPQCFQPGEEPQAAALTESDILRAFRRIPLPESEMSIQPPGGETLVNLDTVFSTEAAGFTRTVGLLGHRVELDIWASEFRWVTGDGKSLLTDWSGKPWRKGTSLAELITHRYEDAVKGLRPRVDTTWSARYRVDGGPWRDVPGTVTIEGEPYDLVVRSAEPHLTG